MPTTVPEFDRTSLVRLPLPLAQLLRLAHDGPDARARHRYATDLFEATIKLAASVLVAAYVRELQVGGPRAPALDATWKEFKRPSLGHWVAILRELSRYFGRRADAASHPLGHVAAQLEDPLRDRPALLDLYRRINKKGAGGAPKNVESCSVSGVIEEINAYRNDLAHGADRGDDFYNDMATRLLSAANELLAEATLDLFGPRGSRLVCLGEIKQVAAGEFEVGLRELTGAGTIRIEPTRVNAVQAAALLSNRVAIVWPGHTVPLRLDPLLDFRDSKLHEEVQFLNAVRGKQLEYLGYFSGETPRDAAAAASLASLLALVLGHGVEFGEEAPLAAAAAPREFEIIAEIGRGGMGVVYLARQLSLGRLVALKTLPAELSGDEVALARFDREIRALGQCDDPHIVKVLTSGKFSDGQRYYAMEYVPGADLEFVWRELSGKNREGSAAGLGGTTWSRAVLTACHKQRTETAHRAGAPTVAGAAGGLTRHHPPTGELNDAAPRSSAEAVALWAQLPPLPELPAVEHDVGGYARRVAALIRDAARAVQAVHDQNIVHRDVSPANLMLTPDGARIVLMDFGLAKGNTRTLEASRSAGLLGKLRYAAPEQLAAANVKVGPRADIRGLGVTLWELLTRERLFGDAEDEKQLTGWVLNRRLPRIRAIDPTLDRDLEAIVAKATENDQNDRLGSARELAELLDLYLAGKTVWVRVPGAAELLRRWVREHRGLVRLAVGAAAAIVLIVVIAFAKINAARNEAVESEKKAQDLAREKSALAAEKTALADSERQARERADLQSQLAMKTLNSVVFDIQSKLEGVPGAQEVRRSLLNTAIEGLKQVARTLETIKTADYATIWSHFYLGDTFLYLGSSTGSATEEAHKQFDAAQELALKLARADPTNAQAQRDLSISYNKLGNVQLQLGNAAAARDDYQKRLEISRKLAQADPSNVQAQRDLSVSYNYLGNVQLQLGDAAAARDDYQKDLEISRKLAQADPSNAQAQRDLSVSYNKLGNVQLKLGNAAAARDDYQKGLEIRRKLAQADPSNAQAQRDLANSYSYLGNVQLQLGDAAAARDDYQKDLEISRKLAQADPSNAQAQRDLSVSYNKLGNVQLQLGDAAAARDDYQKGLEIRRKLAQADPSNAQAQAYLAYSFGCLGRLEMGAKAFAAAIGWFEQGVAILSKLEGEGKIAGQPIYQGWLKDQRDQLHSCQAALAKEAETPNGNKQAAPAVPAVPH
ncbi:MAG TPA: tetratricopeptide repeat protein [Pirellulales bacterium]|jgi:serine/threonine protein kinase/Flp pilus assembly protein TadD|nr:tetratricopeptide repeat protein [Pirellulales bacterium]